MDRGESSPQTGGETPGSDALKRVRSEGCVLRRQPLVRNSPLPLTACYRLEEVIGRGSFGCTVFAATDVLSGVRRVVKCVRKEEPEGIRLWRNEVRILRTLDHPNVLRLFEVFDESGAVYQVTETCHGGDLHQWLDRRLRRRRRHARKQQNGFFVQLAHESRQQDYQPQQMIRSCGALRAGGFTVSVAADMAVQKDDGGAGTRQTPDTEEATAMLVDSGNATSSEIVPGGHRSGTCMRGVCPAAAGAAAAAATAALAGLQSDASPTAAPADRPLVREEVAARLMAQLLGALRYVHSKGIAHCDVKLENLLLLNELEDSEAGDGQSSDEEEEQLRREEEEEQKRQLLLLQQQEQDAAALSRARRGLRARSSAHLNRFDGKDNSSKGVSPSSSANALAVVPMVLRKRRSYKDTQEGTNEGRTPSASSQYLFEGLSRRDATIKLADFGLARKIVKAKPPKDASNFGEGTLYYRSPWIIRGLTEGDARSDLWAAGVALYILLSGKPPFDGNDQQEVEKAVSESPVSFRGGIWSSVSLPCVGFLRALLYNPILPLHLRGPPPPPPYAQPSADLMLKHPWIQQCVRTERRRGLMRALSAPSMKRVFGCIGGPLASDSVPHFRAMDSQGREASGGIWQLGHPQRAPSEPTQVNKMQTEHLLHSGDVEIVRAASDSPLRQTTAHPHAALGVVDPQCCSTCSSWKCSWDCYSVQQQQAGPQPLRLCWGRAPLVAGRALAPQQHYHQQQQQLEEQYPQQEVQHQKQLCSAGSDVMTHQQGSTYSDNQDMQEEQQSGLGIRCALGAAGVSSLVCTSCGGTDPSVFKYEDIPAARGMGVTAEGVSDEDTEQLQPHLRLSGASSGLHGLDSCVAATNAAAAAAAAAAGVAKAVRREAVTRVSDRARLPLENVPHFHLRFHSSCIPLQDGCNNDHLENMETEAATPHDSPRSEGPCCIVVVDWLTAELFEARVPLLLQACAWLDFARLSPLQRALRSVVVKLMEEDAAVRLVRDVLRVLDPQQSGSVSRPCLLDSLKVVRDFLSLEFALRQSKEESEPAGVADALETATGGAALFKTVMSPVSKDQPTPRTPTECESPSLFGSGWTDKAPASPLQAMLMFAVLPPGELPPLDVLEPYCKVLQRALEPEPVAATSSDAPTSHVKEDALKSSPSEVSTTTGDCVAHSCQLDEALVCLDTDGSGGVEFDEFLAASMTRADFKEREPACSVAFRLLDRNVDGFVSTNDLLSILHFDSRSNLQGVLQDQKQRAHAAVAAYKFAVAAAQASGGPLPPGALLDDSELVTGRDEHGALMSVPAGASYILQLEGVTAATVQLYVEVARELKAVQHRPSGLWTFEEFMKLL